MMKRCPYCAEEIRAEAIKCRYCGEFLDDTAMDLRRFGYTAPRYWGYQYRSRAELLGLPLVHIAQGVDPQTGRPYIARGIIAIGNIAIGIVALGGVAIGGIALGGFGLGLFALGGLAIGGVALGGVALGAVMALGGMAVALQYAIGGLTLAPHVINATHTDPALLQALKQILPFITR